MHFNKKQDYYLFRHKRNSSVNGNVSFCRSWTRLMLIQRQKWILKKLLILTRNVFWYYIWFWTILIGFWMFSLLHGSNFCISTVQPQQWKLNCSSLHLRYSNKASFELVGRIISQILVLYRLMPWLCFNFQLACLVL